MFSIMQGSEVLESTPRIERVKLQTNGKKVTSTEADFHYYYSPKTDKLYDKETTSITEVTTLEQAMAVKLAELSELCNAAINAGATVTARRNHSPTPPQIRRTFPRCSPRA